MNCTYCSGPALLKCRNHRRYVCAELDCASEHRLSVRQDPCEMVDADYTSWQEHVTCFALALAGGLLLLAFIAL